jgi:hypothetical protein
MVPISASLALFYSTIYISLCRSNHRLNSAEVLTNWALRHENVWGSGCIDPHFLDLGISWRWVVSFTPLPLYPWERAPGTHFIGGWVDPRAGLGLELPPPMVVQPVASRYTDWAIPAQGFIFKYIYVNWNVCSSMTYMDARKYRFRTALTLVCTNVLNL